MKIKVTERALGITQVNDSTASLCSSHQETTSHIW